jgi:hypothetical protein
MNLKRTWTRAEQTPNQRPLGKGSDSVVASIVSNAADADIVGARRAKSQARGSLKFKREHMK